MHDVISDVAIAISSEGKYAFPVPATSLWCNDVEKLPDVLLERPQLQILMLECSLRASRLSDNFFAKMNNLIVLDMTLMRFQQLPQSFATLKNLRTLRFHMCYLRDISAIGKLTNLVYLCFDKSNIEVLPKEVGELSNLRLLDLSNCIDLKVITPGVIQNLSQLEVLGIGKDIRWCDGKEECCHENASLLELIHLSRLMILDICIPDASMLPDDPLFENLTKFKVTIGKVYLERKTNFLSDSCMLKLTSISNNMLLKAAIKNLIKKAQLLHLEGISGISVVLPSRLGGYGSLKELIVNNCEDVNYVLDMTESEDETEIPSLQRLHLIDLPLLKEIFKGKFSSLFVSKLEHLKLRKLPSLIHLWPFKAVSNLITMTVESAPDELEYIFENGSAKSLSKLKKLKVINCRNLKVICMCEEQDDDIVFSQLSYLKLSDLENLTSFCSKCTSESTLFGKQVIFLSLEKLEIERLMKLEKIWHIHTPVEFFQLKVLLLAECPELLVVFPPQSTSGLQNLEEIHIRECHKLKTLFQLEDAPLRNLREIRIESCDSFETLFQSNCVPLVVGDEMVVFGRLLTLHMVHLPKFTAIVRTTSHNISQATVIFSATEIMAPYRLHNLDSIMDQRLLTFFPDLKKLELNNIGDLSSTVVPFHMIKGLEALEELIIKDCSVNNLPQVMVTLPKLRELYIDHIQETIELCEMLNRYGGFQSLTSLHLHGCNGVKNLFRPSAFSPLVQLQVLLVTKCESVESIVEETGEEQNLDKAIEFSKLRRLVLGFLPSLTSFCNGECALKFPCLEDVDVIECPKLKTFVSVSREMPEPSCQNLVSKEALFGQQVSCGQLNSLRIYRLDSIEEIWHHGHPATIVCELTRLNVKGCDRLLKLFPTNLLTGLQKLSWLCVESCRSLEHVFEVEDHLPLLSNLRNLLLNNLPEFKESKELKELIKKLR